MIYTNKSLLCQEKIEFLSCCKNIISFSLSLQCLCTHKVFNFSANWTTTLSLVLFWSGYHKWPVGSYSVYPKTIPVRLAKPMYNDTFHAFQRETSLLPLRGRISYWENQGFYWHTSFSPYIKFWSTFYFSDPLSMTETIMRADHRSKFFCLFFLRHFWCLLALVLISMWIKSMG